jgi:hypothetical protein
MCIDFWKKLLSEVKALNIPIAHLIIFGSESIKCHQLLDHGPHVIVMVKQLVAFNAFTSENDFFQKSKNW